MKTTFRFAFRRSLPVMAGYVVLGIGFGVLLSSHGYSWWWSLLMSLTIYAGSMQYVSVDLLAGGASLLSAALMTLMVNARHIFYAVTMLTRYRDTGKVKPYLIFALTDETFSLVCAPELPAGIDRRYYYFFVSVLDQCYWVIGSVIGGVLGNTFTFNSAGVDFSMTALFVIIFIEQWESTKDHRAALTGVIASVICLLLFGPSRFLIPAVLAITAALLLLRGRLGKEDET